MGGAEVARLYLNSGLARLVGWLLFNALDSGLFSALPSHAIVRVPLRDVHHYLAHLVT